MITKVYKNEMPKVSGYINYYMVLYKGHHRWLKIGTSTRGTQRFNDKDYRKYTKIVPLYIFEVENEDEMYDFEDLGRTYLRNQKGLKFVKNDRFTFFRLPDELPTFFFGKEDFVPTK